jgi:hypothetical protein
MPFPVILIVDFIQNTEIIGKPQLTDFAPAYCLMDGATRLVPVQTGAAKPALI